jgi:hypothetical protein
MSLVLLFEELPDFRTNIMKVCIVLSLFDSNILHHFFIELGRDSHVFIARFVFVSNSTSTTLRQFLLFLDSFLTDAHKLFHCGIVALSHIRIAHKPIDEPLIICYIVTMTHTMSQNVRMKDVEASFLAQEAVERERVTQQFVSSDWDGAGAFWTT